MRRPTRARVRIVDTEPARIVVEVEGKEVDLTTAVEAFHLSGSGDGTVFSVHLWADVHVDIAADLDATVPASELPAAEDIDAFLLTVGRSETWGAALHRWLAARMNA